MKVTLARAMKEKNRVIGKINELNNKIYAFNVFQNPDEEVQKILKMEDEKTDITNEFLERGRMIDILSEIKSIITKANVENGITNMIYKKEELKTYLSFLKSIPTNTRVQSFSLGEDKIAYVKTEAQISKRDVESSYKHIQKEIEFLQDKIDELNATVYVEIPEYE